MQAVHSSQNRTPPMTSHDWTAIIIAGFAFIIFVATLFAHPEATQRLNHEALDKVSDGKKAPILLTSDYIVRRAAHFRTLH